MLARGSHLRAAAVQDVALPEGRDVLAVDRSILTGEGYRLRWAAATADVPA